MAGNSLKDRLEIFLVTYNRAENLKKTFEQLFDDCSPVKNFDITVLDNKSTDNTSLIVKSYQQKYKNLKYIRRNYNIGANANIARAYELSSKDYIWILADDDNYDFSSWGEVEQAVLNNESIIMVSKYALHGQSDLYRIIIQATFTPSVILSSKLLNDTVLRNIYDYIYTMYVQLIPVITGLNNGEKVCIIKGGSIVTNGNDYGMQNDICFHSQNYHRGAEADKLFFKNGNMSQAAGLANVFQGLQDKNLKETFIEANYKSALFYFRPLHEEISFFADFWLIANKWQKINIILKILKADKIIFLYKTQDYLNIKFLWLKTHLYRLKAGD